MWLYCPPIKYYAGIGRSATSRGKLLNPSKERTGGKLLTLTDRDHHSQDSYKAWWANRTEACQCKRTNLHKALLNLTAHNDIQVPVLSSFTTVNAIAFAEDPCDSMQPMCGRKTMRIRNSKIPTRSPCQSEVWVIIDKRRALSVRKTSDEVLASKAHVTTSFLAPCIPSPLLFVVPRFLCSTGALLSPRSRAVRE